MKLKLDLVIHKRARDEEKKKEEGSEVGQACVSSESVGASTRFLFGWTNGVFCKRVTVSLMDLVGVTLICW